MSKTKKMPSNLKARLDELDKLEEETEKLMDDNKSTNLWPTPEQVKSVRNKMNGWDFEAMIEHLMTGKVENTEIDLKVKAEFELDVASMLKGYKKTKHIHAEEMMKEIAKEGESSKELGEIVMEALMARSYGVSTKIQTIENGSGAKSKSYQELDEDKVGILEMHISNELVRFDYSALLDNLLSGRAVVDVNLMTKNLWAPVESFKKKKEFDSNFSWDDNGLSHSALMEFKKK